MSFDQILQEACSEFVTNIGKYNTDPDELEEFWTETQEQWEQQISTLNLTPDQRAKYEKAKDAAQGEIDSAMECMQGDEEVEQPLGFVKCAACEKEFNESELKTGKDGNPYCAEHCDAEGCFAFGTKLMRLEKGIFVKTDIEKARVGDKILTLNESCELMVKTIYYVDIFAPQDRMLTKITLASGKTVTTTGHHMMVVKRDKTLVMRRADAVQVGDCFIVYGEGNTTRVDQVVASEQLLSAEGVAHVLSQGHVFANGIAASVRCDGDVPDLLFSAANFVSEYVGSAVTPAVYAVDKLNKQLKLKSD